MPSPHPLIPALIPSLLPALIRSFPPSPRALIPYRDCVFSLALACSS